MIRVRTNPHSSRAAWIVEIAEGADPPQQLAPQGRRPELYFAATIRTRGDKKLRRRTPDLIARREGRSSALRSALAASLRRRNDTDNDAARYRRGWNSITPSPSPG